MLERVDRYRLLRHLGHGGMGEVFLARLEAIGQVQRLVAIKFLRDVASEGAPDLMREARLTALVSHPNVVQILDAGLDGDRPWFAMEFVPGLSLADLLAEAGSRLPPWVAARVTADLALGVHALHEAKDERGNRLEIVHRDLSPQNVLVSWDGVVKLLDLGIARSQLWAGSTNSGFVRGKLGYMSPEQAAGRPVDRRSDLFALGVLLWEALAGRRLFRGGTDGELLAQVIRGDVPPLEEAVTRPPPALVAIAHLALALRPADRFATALEMHRALEVAVRGAGVIVGADEIARAAAALVPNRIREHEAWLRDADADVARGANDLLANKIGPVAVSIARKPAPPWYLGLGPLLVTLAAVVAASLLLVFALRSHRLAEHRASERTAGDGSMVRGSSGAAPTSIVPTESASLSVGFASPAARDGGRAARENVPASRPRTLQTGSVTAPVESASLDPGTINVVSSPSWATISLDGKVAGETPLVMRDVSGGSHTLEARVLGTGSPKLRVVTVLPGRATRVEFTAE
ncbi:MAG TPA: serine/threonine-protein kinase [Polyangiaceae bacterium]|jgi:serine/threonine-protein kinase|nr:serine/threonine-protein kinase [Polyangiaceae bacterium]